MKEYKLLEADDRLSIVVNVNAALKAGWNCQGGVALHHRGAGYSNPYLYAQSMVREAKEST